MLPEPGDATVQTLELLWRAAPEQIEELDQIFADGIQARLSKGQSPEIGVYYNVLQIPEEMLVQLWLLAHAGWQDFLNFQDRKKGNQIPEGTHTTSEAIQAAKAIFRHEKVVWPKQIPAFNEVRAGSEAKAVREIYAMACAWVIAHEIQHAKFYGYNNRPNDGREEEMLCDTYACDFLFSKVEKYSQLTGEDPHRVRDKRAIAAFVGLYFVARISEPDIKNSAHPSIGQRIKLMFNRLNGNQLKHFWDFALALICELEPEIASSPVDIANPTSRDLAYFALEHALGD